MQTPEQESPRPWSSLLWSQLPGPQSGAETQPQGLSHMSSHAGSSVPPGVPVHPAPDLKGRPSGLLEPPSC